MIKSIVNERPSANHGLRWDALNWNVRKECVKTSPRKDLMHRSHARRMTLRNDCVKISKVFIFEAESLRMLPWLLKVLSLSLDYITWAVENLEEWVKTGSNKRYESTIRRVSLGLFFSRFF